MFRLWLQPTHRFLNNRRRQPLQLRPRFSSHPFRQCRARGDRRRAPPDLIPRFRYSIILESCGQPQHVATRRIRYVDSNSRRRKLAHIARILEMIQQPLAMHSCFNYRVDVVAAVIERNGRVLICQRKGGRHALKWEFPGGKVERGETPPQALARELREELAIEARVGDLIESHEVRYGNGPLIRLHFYRVTDFTGEPMNLQFERIVWEPRAKLPRYDFLDGDLAFVRRLAAM
jgi:mutator protein MutT